MNFAKLDALIDSLPHCGIPSADVEIRREHEVVYRRMAGYADAAKTRPISEKSLYWIWSCSKVSLCMAGLKLLEEGKIALDDPIAKYIPQFDRLFVKDGTLVRPPRTELLVRHAFTMQSGWDYGATGRIRDPEGPRSNSELAAEIAAVPLNFDPGTHFEYGYSQDLLGAIVENLTGRRLGDYLKENFFDPLGMKDTGFHPTEEQLSRITDRYEYDNEANTSVVMEPKDANGWNGIDMGSGGLFSCTGDYSLLMDALANGGVGATGARVLKAETVELCRHNLLDPVSLQDFHRWQLWMYGYGWGLCGRVNMDNAISRSRSPEGEFGWNGAAASYAMADAENHVSIFLAQHVHNCIYSYQVVEHQLRDLTYEALGL